MASSGSGQQCRTLKRGYKPLGSIKSGKYFDWLRNYYSVAQSGARTCFSE